MTQRLTIAILLGFLAAVFARPLPASARASETGSTPAVAQRQSVTPAGLDSQAEAVQEEPLESPHPWTEVGTRDRGFRLFPTPHRAAPFSLSAPWSGRDSFRLDSAAFASVAPDRSRERLAAEELDLKALRLTGDQVDLPKPRPVSSDKARPKLFAKTEVVGNVTTFAEWTGSGRDNAFQAGVDVSLFSRSRLRVTHRMHPFRPARILEEGAVTEASLGVDLGSGGMFRLSGRRGDQETEVGTGLFYRPNSSLEVGAQARSIRPHIEGAPAQPWTPPALEGKLRLTW